jgi:hypothetical protein
MHSSPPYSTSTCRPGAVGGGEQRAGQHRGGEAAKDKLGGSLGRRDDARLALPRSGEVGRKLAPQARIVGRYGAGMGVVHPVCAPGGAWTGDSVVFILPKPNSTTSYHSLSLTGAIDRLLIHSPKWTRRSIVDLVVLVC